MQNSSPFVIPADITAKVEEIMSGNRARFGHDAFRMEDPPAGPPADQPPADPPADPPPADEPPADLGDAGKKALDAMKAERKAAKDAAAAEKARADALQAKLDGKEAEHLAAQEKAAADKLVLDKANGRILNWAVQAAAKGVLADPADAHKFLDLDAFEVDDDGNVDEAAIAKALADLVKSKPYLAAQGGKFGNPDGGPRNGDAKSIDDQIVEATKAGNHALAISLKRQKAYASNT